MKFSQNNKNLILKVHLKEIEKIIKDDFTSMAFKDKLIKALDELDDVDATLSQAGSLLKLIENFSED
jgi:hypothetical protein